MPNGDVATKEEPKIDIISKKIDHIKESTGRNLNLSSEIRAKLLSTETKIADAEKQIPMGPGKLDQIIDSLQEILNLVNSSNSHLTSVNNQV